MSGWIGVDLDGTLAQYDGWQGIEHIGTPIPAMVERVKGWLAEGREVRIFTARISEPGSRAAVRFAVNGWLREHLGQQLPITCTKDFGMVELWDDRAVTVEANTGRPLGLMGRELPSLYERHTQNVFSLVKTWDERDAALERVAELEADAIDKSAGKR